MIFTWLGDPSCPIPLCIIYEKQLTNAAKTSAKLKIPIITDQQPHDKVLITLDGYWNHRTCKVKLLLIK